MFYDKNTSLSIVYIKKCMKFTLIENFEKLMWVMDRRYGMNCLVGNKTFISIFLLTTFQCFMHNRPKRLSQVTQSYYPNTK